MELQSVEVEAVRSLWLPMQETLILPIGDIQLDPVVKDKPRACDIKRLKKYVEWGVAHGGYFLGMGDYVDVMSPSNRERYKSAGFYDSVQDALESKAEEVEDELRDILAPTRGRWLGLLEGHHFFPHSDGSTTDTRLANYLGTSFLGTSAMVEVKFEAAGKHAAPSFVIWAHHGRAGGKLLATPLNQLEGVMKSFEADVYLVGHHHKKVAGKYPLVKTEFATRGNKHHLVHKNRILACTGSYLKGYQEYSQREGRAQGGYVEAGMMNPVALGGIVLVARPRYEDHHRVATVDLDVVL